MSVISSLVNNIHQVCSQRKTQIHTTKIEQIVEVNFIKANIGMYIAHTPRNQENKI